MKISIFLLLIQLLLISICTSDYEHMKIIQFDYSNILNSNISAVKNEFVEIFKSVDYYLGLLFKKNELKDYNFYNKMYRDITQHKLKCGFSKVTNFDKKSLIQKDVSFLVIPKLEKKIKINDYAFRKTICKDEYSIPRVITLFFQYKDENTLESVLKNETEKNYIFSNIMQLVFGNIILELHNLKRNKLISAFPEKYLYFISYKKFMDLTKQDELKFYDNFLYIGNYSNWPVMPYFNDYLSKEYTKEDSIKLSFTEITLNLLVEYPYEVPHCDLLYYKGKKCFRIDQKCFDDCSIEKYFLEYYIDEKNKRLICNLKTGDDLKNQKCGKFYGNVNYHEFMETKSFKDNINSNEMQKLLLLKPSPKCPTPHPRTIFFEYMDYYRDDPYYYIKNNINVEYLELKDPKYFVVGKIDKEKSYMAKYRSFVRNNILTKNLPDWNYNVYWDSYPILDNNNDRGIFFEYNKYQLYGKFPDENINKYDIYNFYNKLKNKYPSDYNYLLETLLWPEEKSAINKKFKNYKYNPDNIWILKREKENEIDNNNIYPHIFTDLNEIKGNNDKYILNRYLTNPLLINNKKFSMKTFVLVTGFSPLKIYFYRDGYLTFSQSNFTLNENNVKDACIHISSEKNEFKCGKNDYNNFTYEDSLFDEKCFIWNFLNFERYCKKHDIDYNMIIAQMKDIIIKTFISVNADIINKIKKLKIKDRNMFQLFTFDFILDTNNKVYLIDIDKNPSLNSKHLVPVYIYDHLISDILNIVGVVPYSHEDLQKPWDENIYNYENEISENIDDALCEFTRQKGVFELVFPLKKNINSYKKYFDKIIDENKMLWDKLLNSDVNYE